MKVIIEPKNETEILEATRKDADPKKIRETFGKQAECCVDHLCGCNCGC